MATIVASPARGYICSQAVPTEDSASPPSLSWFSRQIRFTLQPDGTAQIPEHQEYDVLRAAFAVWEQLMPQDGGACDANHGDTDILFLEEAPASASRQIGFNFLRNSHNENVIIFRDTDWHQQASDSRLIIALTTTTHNTVTGEIYDADIEFNSEDFLFTIGEDAPETDLMNTAVHEIGHFLGLGHTAANTAQGLSFAAARETTMHAEAVRGETKKRTLHCDDARAIAFKYPTAADNGYCDPSVSACGGCAPPVNLLRAANVDVTSRDDGLAGCAATGSTGTAPLWLVTTITAVAWFITRRGRRPAHSARGPSGGSQPDRDQAAPTPDE